MTARLRALLDAPDLQGLAANIAVGLVATVVVCLAIAILGWLDAGPSDVDALPGVLVSMIWTALIAGFGAARWHAGRAGRPASNEQGAITAVAAACLLYPFYTSGLSSLAIGLVANLLIAVACARIADRLLRPARLAAVLMALPIPWLVLASLLIVREWALAPR